MKILHFASGDLWAGAEVQLFHLAKKLAQRDDIELLVVLLNRGQLEDELRRHGVNVFIIEESRLSGFTILKKLNKLVKEFQPDVIHTHRLKENIIGGFVSRLNGKKSLRTVHGANEIPKRILNFRWRILAGLDKLIAGFMQQKVVAVSEDLMQKLSKIYPPSKLVVIENCVDIDFIEQQASQQSPDMGALNRNSFHIAFVGRFVPVKRVDLFYAIAKEIVHGEPGASVHFHMFGDGPLKSDIEARIRGDDIAENVHLHGFVRNVAPVLKQMGLLLFTSDHEGLPMTLLEAMTLRVPVLSGQLPSIRNVLCDGGCGYFVDSDSADDFAVMIRHVMSNPDDVHTKVNAARELIERKYNIDANVEKYLQLYHEVLGLH